MFQLQFSLIRCQYFNFPAWGDISAPPKIDEQTFNKKKNKTKQQQQQQQQQTKQDQKQTQNTPLYIKINTICLYPVLLFHFYSFT